MKKIISIFLLVVGLCFPIFGEIPEIGNSNEFEFIIEEKSYADVFVEVDFFLNNTSKASIKLGNTGERIAYDYTLRVYYENYSYEKIFSYLDISKTIIFNISLYENSSFLGVLLLPTYKELEQNYGNNYVLFNKTFQEKPSKNSWILESYSDEYDSQSLGLELNDTLEFFWNDSLLFNLSEDYVYLDFSKKNDLIGEYMITLQADDYADFYINEELVLQTFDPQERYVIDSFSLVGNETFFVFYGEDDGEAFLNLSFHKLK